MSRNPKRAPDKSLGNNSEKLSIKRNPVEAGSCAVAAGKEGERSTNMLSQRGKGSSVSTKGRRRRRGRIATDAHTRHVDTSLEM